MELIERAGFLDSLRNRFERIAKGEGHCILITGEAGIGKTSLVNAFCREREKDCKIFHGTCDSLFTPRPLAPLYDIALQMSNDFMQNHWDQADRTALFTSFLQELGNQKEAVVIVFEDIHWADEATLDFIKFLARRITRVRCLFILTYRDDEIHSRHPLRNVLGQLPPDSFTRLELTTLSEQAVEMLATEKGRNGKEVYKITGGNPFYVQEILASYCLGIPDNIKDSILSTYNRLGEKPKQIWELLSVIPSAFEIKHLEKIEPLYAVALENCIEAKIIFIKDGRIFFKHELFRRAIESSLSPLKRINLNKRILDLLLETFEVNHEIERIVHHAKNANEYELVVYYAPLAARQAATLRAHTEASKLYLSAIEYYQGDDPGVLLPLYESYTYECYLTNQISEAIIYAGKSLRLLKKGNDPEKLGNCLRILSRLWWFHGNHKEAVSYGDLAVEVLEHQPSSRAKAMTFSNISQLKMLSDQVKECIYWGERAIAIARELNDQETIAHSLNNMGSALMTIESSNREGILILEQSLKLAREYCYHEHVARAYTALGSNAVTMKDYAFAKKTLEEGIDYCEERDLDSLKLYMLGWKARLNLETGNWKEAYSIAETLLRIEDLAPVIRINALVVKATLKMRRGEPDPVPLMLEAKTLAFGTLELQRIIPALSALLEWEWLTGNTILETEALDQAVEMIAAVEKISKKNKLYYWLRKARNQYLPVKERYEGYEISSAGSAMKEASHWENLGCPYEQALDLFEGGDEQKRKAIALIQTLGANAVYEKMKQEMRGSGIKSIPRGLRKTTQSNPALLTNRELDVLRLLNESLQNKDIASRLYISAKTVDHHISSIFFKLDVNSRLRAVHEALKMGILK